MKKILPFLMIGALGITAISCSRTVDRQVITETNTSPTVHAPVVYDIQENFKFEDNRFQIKRNFKYTLPESEVVLVYRRSGVQNGANVWQPIPRTLYLEQGELDYDFDFTVRDVTMYAAADFNIAAQNAEFQNRFMNQQAFRVLFVPSTFGSKIKLDYNNYEEVAKFYNIQEKDVKKL